MLVITNTVLKSIASKARPSVSEAEIKDCMASTVSLWIQSDLPIVLLRDAKGKWATQVRDIYSKAAAFAPCLLFFMNVIP
ncbi:hypothetical protein ES319_D10G120800v1 [Gossypium barbadense]|uniref:Uncharacterized protein n=2 Tax=Gossypium TaxID=3633 RepID=A0A5J5PPP9_GOSBA|nr:hypothetical protein ES319_D10G120800v1 [Gossypium barbadense]TYG49873.1 hypothetical protein ES288_D10G129000v1 [Gossypium darwinii]